MSIVWFPLLAGCGSPATEEPAPAPAPSPAPAHDDHHAAHGAGADHMRQMASVREGLRNTLGAAYDAPVAGTDTASVDAGRALYVTHCAPCHGDTGKGDGPQAAALQPPPGDFTDAFHARYYSDAGRVHLIRKGIPGTAMPPFEGTLTDQQILDVYVYVRTLRGKPEVVAPAPHDGHEH